MNVLQRLDELLEESLSLDARAQELQADGLFDGPNAHVVQQFQKQADAWYVSVFDILPADLRERFEWEWHGPDGDCGPADFVADPTGWGDDWRQAYDEERNQVLMPGKVHFTYSYERCFREPLRQQRRILIEARHYPEIANQVRRDERGVITQLDLDILHPQIVSAAGALFLDGHYKSAILEACTVLTGALKSKSEITDRDGIALVEHVFSFKNPILTISGTEDEQKGMIWLLKGAVMGLRHPRAHHSSVGTDQGATEAFEWLAFISALMRVVERSEQKLIRVKNFDVPKMDDQQHWRTVREHL